MAAKGRNWLLKKRTWLGAAVAAGVIIGMNFPEFWKGFGGGGPNLIGLGPSGTGSQTLLVSTNSQPARAPERTGGTKESAPEIPETIKVVIAERSFSLRSNEGEQPVELAEVIRQVRRATGDADGIRLRIYRKSSSRPSAESALQSALAEAGIPEDAVLWVPGTGD